MNENETIPEIAAEIGEKSDFCHNNVLSKGWDDWEKMHKWLLDLRRRIEAAWKREQESWQLATKEAVKIETKSMKTCLVNILTEMIDLGGMEVGRKAKFSPDAIADEIRSALATAEGGAE